MVNSNQVVCFISCQGLCTHIEWLYLKFQFRATNFMSMAAKLSDLLDETSGVNLQMEGHTDMCHIRVQRTYGSQKDQTVLSPTCCLGPQPRGCLSRHPNTKHCLEIHMTLTEELGAIPPPSHFRWPPSWRIWCMMLGLDSLKRWWQAQVGQFFSMGDIQWEKAWLQTRLDMPHSYSQEQVCGLENQPTLLQTPWQSKKVEGAMLKLYQIIKLRQGDQDITVWICQSNNPSSLIPQEVSLWRMHLGMVVLIINHHPFGPQEAKNVIHIGETKGLNHLGSLHLPWTMGLRVTGVHYWQLPQCHLGLTGQMDPNIP